jgi:hypothetical protein
VNSELEMMEKEPVEPKSEVPSEHLTENTERIKNKSVTMDHLLSDI